MYGNAAIAFRGNRKALLILLSLPPLFYTAHGMVLQSYLIAESLSWRLLMYKAAGLCLRGLRKPEIPEKSAQKRGKICRLQSESLVAQSLISSA